MKTITIDDKLYAFIASQTKHIGESASDILRRILMEDHGLVEGEPEKVDLSKPKQVSKAVSEINKVKQNKVREEHHEVVNASAVFNLLSDKLLNEQMSKVERFLVILGALHNAHAKEFDRVLEIKGKGRLYFAKNEQTLLASGSSTNPKAIPGSEYWVVTNNNTAKKRSMLAQTAQILGYNPNAVEKLNKLFDPS